MILPATVNSSFYTRPATDLHYCSNVGVRKPNLFMRLNPIATSRAHVKQPWFYFTLITSLRYGVCSFRNLTGPSSEYFKSETHRNISYVTVKSWCP